MAEVIRSCGTKNSLKLTAVEREMVRELRGQTPPVNTGSLKTPVELEVKEKAPLLRPSV